MCGTFRFICLLGAPLAECIFRHQKILAFGQAVNLSKILVAPQIIELVFTVQLFTLVKQSALMLFNTYVCNKLMMCFELYSIAHSFDSCFDLVDPRQLYI